MNVYDDTDDYWGTLTRMSVCIAIQCRKAITFISSIMPWLKERYILKEREHT
jgi:hypothetical protein